MKKFALILIKSYFRTSSALSPKFAARQAFRFFQRTAKKTFKPKEEEFYKTSSKFIVQGNRGEIVCYENGNPDGNIVFLVHGWNSNAGSLSGITQALVNEGYRTISFDLPAHGKSTETHTNLLLCKEDFQTIIRFVAPKNPIIVVAHSFGSMVSSFAFSELSFAVEKMILLTCPDTVIDIFEQFRDIVGLGEKAHQLVVNRAQSLLGEKLDEVSTLSKIQIVKPKELVLIHDVHDKILPHSYSEKLANNYHPSLLHSFKKVGHYRMLWNEEIISTIASELKQGVLSN